MNDHEEQVHRLPVHRITAIPYAESTSTAPDQGTELATDQEGARGSERNQALVPTEKAATDSHSEDSQNKLEPGPVAYSKRRPAPTLEGVLEQQVKGRLPNGNAREAAFPEPPEVRNRGNTPQGFFSRMFDRFARWAPGLGKLFGRGSDPMFSAAPGQRTNRIRARQARERRVKDRYSAPMFSMARMFGTKVPKVKDSLPKSNNENVLSDIDNGSNPNPFGRMLPLRRERLRRSDKTDPLIQAKIDDYDEVKSPESDIHNGSEPNLGEASPPQRNEKTNEKKPLGKIPEVEEEEEEEAKGPMINDNVGRPDEETIQDSQNLSSQGKIHPSGELNARHHSDTDSYLQRRKAALPNLNTGYNGFDEGKVASEDLLARLHQAKPKANGAHTRFYRGLPVLPTPEYDVSELEAVEYQGLLAREGMKDVSTRHSGLDLPSARVHVPVDGVDGLGPSGNSHHDWLTNFSGRNGGLDFFDNPEEADHLTKDVKQNLHQYASGMVEEEKSDPKKTAERLVQGYREDRLVRARVREKFLERENVRQGHIDIGSKRLLGDPKDNMDAKAQSGPMTIGGHEVVPEMKNKDHDPHKPQGGWWFSAATGQKLGYAGLAGKDELEESKSPGGYVVHPRMEFWQGTDVAHQKRAEVIDKAKRKKFSHETVLQELAAVNGMALGGVAEQDIVPAQAAGWGNIGKKPGMFAGKQAKEDYKKKTNALDSVIEAAWGKMKGEEMPSFMKGVPYATKKWQEKNNGLKVLENW